MTQPLIPLVDIHRQHEEICAEINAAVGRVLARGDFVLGEETGEFEKEFAAFHRVPYCVGLGDGTSALRLALLALGVGPGDEVIAPTNTFIASVLAILHTGARPVLVDCDPVYYTIDTKSVERALTTRTRALMPVHLYGHPAEMDPLLEIARDRKLHIVEDVAQAHGATYQGRLCGTMGDIGCFSFYPSKNLGACGDGGAIITHRRDLAERVALLRNYGQVAKNVHTQNGFNSRLDTLQAAILRVKLRYLNRWNKQRRAAAASYRELLDRSSLQTPKVAPWADPVWHLYVIQTAKRSALQGALEAANITSGIHYPIPVHLQPACRDLGYKHGAFPVSESLAKRILSLPMFAEITAPELARVAHACMRVEPRRAQRRAVSMADL